MGSRMAGFCGGRNCTRFSRRLDHFRFAIRLAVQDHAVGVVAQSVEGGRSQQPVGREGLVPFGELPLTDVNLDAEESLRAAVALPVAIRIPASGH